jgi:hypothetical protein
MGGNKEIGILIKGQKFASCSKIDKRLTSVVLIQMLFLTQFSGNAQNPGRFPRFQMQHKKQVFMDKIVR